MCFFGKRSKSGPKEKGDHLPPSHFAPVQDSELHPSHTSQQSDLRSNSLPLSDEQRVYQNYNAISSLGMSGEPILLDSKPPFPSSANLRTAPDVPFKDSSFNDGQPNLQSFISPNSGSATASLSSIPTWETPTVKYVVVSYRALV
jgi:hypothetical protein